MRALLIGNGIQSKRIQQILKNLRISFDILDSKSIINKIKAKKYKFVFILSPNRTHFKFLKYFEKKTYLFCEKPPVNNLQELKEIKKFSHNRIYFNYNFRFSIISEILKNRKKYKLGDLLHANFSITHGLAQKKDYVENWRSKKNLCPTGVFETVLIHYVDLIGFHFQIKKIKNLTIKNTSKIGSGFDTASCKLETKNNVQINFFSTYNSPLSKKILFIFTNGIIEQDENFVKVFGPAKNLDVNGFYKKPKLIKSFKISEKLDHKISLKKSIDYFLYVAKKKKNFSKNLFNKSLKSNELILNKKSYDL
jgi:predicted dehydrogenase